MLIKSTWNKDKTFKLIPIHKDCPYNEAIFDVDQKVLAVISKESKDTFQMVPKFNDKGDVAYLKSPRDNGKNYAEERRALEAYYEYYLEDEGDIMKFVKLFAGASVLDIVQSFMVKKPQIENPVIFEGSTL